MPLIEIIRPYGGQEGRRVKPGTRFAVNEEIEGLRTITELRAKALLRQNLAKTLDGKGLTLDAAPAAQPNRNRATRRLATTPANKQEPDSKPGPSPRDAARRKTKQPVEPREPRPLNARAGIRAGTDAPASSSPEAHPILSSTLKQRGTRRGPKSGGSPSTTPASPPTSPELTTSGQDSSPGLTSSTDATAAGGGPSEASQDSAAFE